jgi:hypothetical protein
MNHLFSVYLLSTQCSFNSAVVAVVSGPETELQYISRNTLAVRSAAKLC